MAPLLQWAVQVLLGSTRTKKFFSSIETPSGITHQTNDNPAIPQAGGSLGVTSVSTGYQRLDVYVGPLENGGLGYIYWRGAEWFPTNEYKNIGGSLQGPPIVISRRTDRNDIFAVGRDNQLWHKGLSGSTWEPSRFGWRSLGGNLSFNYPLAALAKRTNESMDVLGVREEGDGKKSLWRKYWDGSSWQPGEFDFEQIPGSFSSAPAITSRSPNELSIFILDLENNLLHRWWNPSNQQWSEWIPMGQKCSGAPAAVTSAINRTSVICVGFDSALYQRTWVDGQGWLNWENFGGRFVDGGVSILTRGDMTIDLMGLNKTGSYDFKPWYRVWYAPGSGRGWFPEGGSFASPPALASWNAYHLDIFGIALNGSLMHKAWAGLYNYGEASKWTQLMGNPNE